MARDLMTLGYFQERSRSLYDTSSMEDFVHVICLRSIDTFPGVRRVTHLTDNPCASL